jgi:hypothetical protein
MYSQLIQVDETNELEAIESFSKKVGDYHNATDVVHLVRKIDYIPLAIFQAASYIAERAECMTLP